MEKTGFPPGPRGHWLLGSLPERQKTPLKLFMNGALNYGGIVHHRMAFLHVFQLNDPEMIRHVLQENARNYIKGFGYDKF